MRIINFVRKYSNHSQVSQKQKSHKHNRFIHALTALWLHGGRMGEECNFTKIHFNSGSNSLLYTQNKINRIKFRTAPHSNAELIYMEVWVSSLIPRTHTISLQRIQYWSHVMLYTYFIAGKAYIQSKYINIKRNQYTSNDLARFGTMRLHFRSSDRCRDADIQSTSCSILPLPCLLHAYIYYGFIKSIKMKWDEGIPRNGIVLIEILIQNVIMAFNGAPFFFMLNIKLNVILKDDQSILVNK